jgi:hypothetical protein
MNWDALLSAQAVSAWVSYDMCLALMAVEVFRLRGRIRATRSAVAWQMSSAMGVGPCQGGRSSRARRRGRTINRTLQDLP